MKCIIFYIWIEPIQRRHDLPLPLKPRLNLQLLLILSVLFFHCSVGWFQGAHQNPQSQNASENSDSGVFATNIYPNLFSGLLGKSSGETEAIVNRAWQQLFYGDDQTERIYYPMDPDMAYISDIVQNDVRSEGMSYGMMIAVQLNKKEEFDRLWTWAKTYMQHQSGPREGYFSWQNRPDGGIIDPNSAPDGEEYMVMALFFAAARWGNGTGIYHYRNEAQAILDAMLSKAEKSDSVDVVTNMFDKVEKQVVFVPFGEASRFTDPSYHVPHYYELWALWSDKNQDFWTEAAVVSREFFKKAAHPVTGLMPDYARFDGSPIDLWSNGYHLHFRFDAWRACMNIAVDYLWFGKDEWAVTQTNRYLDFFYQQGMDQYKNQYTLEGEPLSEHRSPGLISTNAVACLAATHPHRTEFVKALWDLPVPSGRYRYYNGVLYMLSLLHVSGNFKIYKPDFQ